MTLKFDEYYTYYYEDVDFCVRAQLSGFRLAHVPSAKTIHKESRKGEHRENFDYVFRHTTYFTAKNFGIRPKYILHLFIQTLRTCRHYYLRGKGKIAKIAVTSTFQGLIDGLKTRRQKKQ